MFPTTEKTENSNTQTSVSAQNLHTPKTSVLFKKSSNINVGYFGKLEFLDNQATFAKVFGDKPTIIAPKIVTSQDST